MRIEGIIPALVTPFDGGNDIDVAALENLVQRLLGEGVSGLYVCGSTAECHLLSPTERKRVVEVVCRTVAHAIPLVVHVGTISTDVAVELSRHAADCGADAVSAIPPFFYPFSLDEIKEYYRAIAASTPLPVIIYNFPALTGVTLSAENAADLLSDDRVLGVKHTSKDLAQLQRMRSHFPRLTVLNGYDQTLLAGLGMGADGGIGSTYNFMAPRFLRLLKAFTAGDRATALRLQGEANDIIEVLHKVGVFPAIKYILGRQGINVGTCRPPFHSLDAGQTKALDAILERV